MTDSIDEPEWADAVRGTLSQLIERSFGEQLLMAFGQDVSDALNEAIKRWQGKPERLREILNDWSEALSEVQSPSAGEFSASNPSKLLDAYASLYKRLVGCLNNLVDEAPDLPDRERHLLKFVARQIISACAPENWPSTNPKVIEKAMRSQGGTLLQGLNLLSEDLARSQMGLKVRTANPDDFKVGESLASTPGEVIYETPLFQLIQYYPASQKVSAEPVLLVPPCINKFYVLDLTPSESLVQWLIRQGHTVFMVSWVNPMEQDQNFGYSDYVLSGVVDAVEQVRNLTRKQKVHLVGYCISGTFSACAAGHLAKQRKDWLKSLTLLNTLLDYSLPGEIDVFVSSRMHQALERYSKSSGVVEGEILGQAFSFLREDRMIWPFVVNSYLLGKRPKPNPLLYWNQDTTNVSASMLLEYLVHMYGQNSLAQSGGYRTDQLKVDLDKIKIPVFVLGSRRDHIVPWRGCYSSAQLFSSPVEFVLAEGGHVSAIAHAPSSSRRKYRISDSFDRQSDAETWNGIAQIQSGSWWPHWQQWLVQHSSEEMIRPRFPGDTGVEPIEAAPGRYVKVSSCASAQIDRDSAQ